MDDDVYGYDFETYSANTVDAIQAVERAVLKVEAAVKDKWSSVPSIGWIVVAVVLWELLGNMWHSKLRYETEYSVSEDRIIADKRPHDCAFLSAPLGEKYCHYDREVSTIHWATAKTGNPIVSYDEGKTWQTFTPDASVKVPVVDTVEYVYVTWKKVEE